MRFIQCTLLGCVIALLLSGCAVLQSVTRLSSDVTRRVELEKARQESKTDAIINCQEVCQDTISANGIDLSVGPCLSETVVEGWACDMAHQPRQAIDDDPANQCESFRAGRTSHFVEVDGNCAVLRIY